MSNMVTIGTQPSPPPPAGQDTKAAVPGQGLQVTDRAIKRIRAAMAKEGISPEEGGLRLGVMGGGCSGLSYSIKFDTKPRERDRIYEFDGVRVFVDPKSFLYLHGMPLEDEVLIGFKHVQDSRFRRSGCLLVLFHRTQRFDFILPALQQDSASARGRLLFCLWVEAAVGVRSEERRVGKECRSRGSP